MTEPRITQPEAMYSEERREDVLRALRLSSSKPRWRAVCVASAAPEMEGEAA